METVTINVNDVIWRKDLYPRFEPSPSRIQQYAEVVEKLPPIEINQHNELIDGYHRWTAHKKVKVDTIQAFVTITKSDIELDRLMTKRNSEFGIQLSQKEKRRKARQWFTGLGTDKQAIADDLSVPFDTVRRWLSRKTKDMKVEQKQKAESLWLACYTEDEIAEKIGIGRTTVSGWVKKPTEMGICAKPAIFSDYNEPDWKPPIYDVWKVQNKSNKASHFGNSEARWIDNLLYMYTEPFNIVVDPFAGGGSTIDVCKQRLRRFWVSDRTPIVERLDIREWDILDGPPDLHKRWGEVKLLYLDPPYWKQAQGEYGDDSNDLSNMELEDFYHSLVTFITDCSQKMHAGAHIALIIQPTQWRAPNRQVVDHIIDLITQLKDAPIDYMRRIVCPYESQQYNAQQVNWAKDNRDILVISREIIIWKVK